MSGLFGVFGRKDEPKRCCRDSTCPEVAGGKCWCEMSREEGAQIRVLREVRAVYDRMEESKQYDTFEGPEVPFVSWRGWKMVRNELTDRIEAICGVRT